MTPRLGRGLAALIPGVDMDEPGLPPDAPKGTQQALRKLRLDRIRPNPEQPRMTFSGPALEELAESIQAYLRAQMPVWKSSYPGVESLSVAVMGCVVNGPGESKHADIGISLPGTGETPAAPVFIDGEKAVTLRGPGIAGEFKTLVTDYIEKRFGAGA